MLRWKRFKVSKAKATKSGVCCCIKLNHPDVSMTKDGTIVLQGERTADVFKLLNLLDADLKLVRSDLARIFNDDDGVHST